MCRMSLMQADGPSFLCRSRCLRIRCGARLPSDINGLALSWFDRRGRGRLHSRVKVKFGDQRVSERVSDSSDPDEFGIICELIPV
jgi:hypothetical protein